MNFFPLLHILFWIALTVSPKNASEITITGPNETWAWTKQDAGWSKSDDKSVWSVDGKTATRKTAAKVDKQDVSKYVAGISEINWTDSSSLQLGLTRVTKAGNTFVYTINQGDPTEKRYVIAFKTKP